MARESRANHHFCAAPRLAEGLASQVLTVTITPSIAASAVELPSTFPKDPADRLIFATALHHGLKIVTKDEAIRGYAGARDVAIW